MLTATTTNDILFDDAAILENRLGKSNWYLTAENISPDCNCSGYTSVEDEEGLNAARIAARSISHYNDCTNNAFADISAKSLNLNCDCSN